MGIGGVGRIPSFWQDNQNSLSQRKNTYRAEKAQKALIDVMYSTQANLSRGLSSIANQTALKRVNSQLSAAVQSALQSLGSSHGGVRHVDGVFIILKFQLHWRFKSIGQVCLQGYSSGRHWHDTCDYSYPANHPWNT